MSDRINCRNCIHFDDLEHRCCLNDRVSVNQRECYFRLSNRTPKGKDVVIEHLKSELAVMKKALELACDDMNKSFGFDCKFYKSDSFYNYFINKAKEMLKDVKNW